MAFADDVAYTLQRCILDCTNWPPVLIYEKQSDRLVFTRLGRPL